jgi:hypothetical protein
MPMAGTLILDEYSELRPTQVRTNYLASIYEYMQQMGKRRKKNK